MKKLISKIKIDKSILNFKKETAHVHIHDNCHKYAFTLAEVLITLTIIGIVTTMTIPTLINEYKKKIIETRLHFFYSTMNNAFRLSSLENGDWNSWDEFTYDRIYDEDGNSSYIKTTNALVWFNKYLAKYIKTTKVEELEDNKEGKILVQFLNGSIMLMDSNSWLFYPNGNDFKGEVDKIKDSGKKYFTFLFVPKTTFPYHKDKLLEPYMYSWDGTREMLLKDNSIGCKEEVLNERAYCTKLIQMNNWKIPKDYPLKF